MKRHMSLGALALVLTALMPDPGAAQAAASPAATGLRADLIAQFDDAAGKLVQLAQAIPQTQYTWRPAPGVRSVSEALLHVANANFFIPSFAGVAVPEGATAGGETGTDRAQIVDRLKRAADHVRAAIRGVRDADLDKPTTMFGRQTTYRNALLLTVVHAHEHLGQMIAYARANNITPPWSAAGQ